MSTNVGTTMVHKDHGRRVAAVSWLMLVLLVSACTTSAVTLGQLVDQQDRFVGDRISVVGQVVIFAEPDGSDSYVLEDADQNRVLLLPNDRVENYEGQQVEITGTFDFDPNRGRLLRVEEIGETTSN